MTLRRGLWISALAGVMPGATMLSALLAAQTDWSSSGAGIALVLLVLAMAATALPIAVWGVGWTVLVRKLPVSEGIGRGLFVASFAALFWLVAALPPGPDGGGMFNSDLGQGLVIGVTVLGHLLRETPLLGVGWVVLIAGAAYAPWWLGVPVGLVGAGVLGLSVLDQTNGDQQTEQTEHRTVAGDTALFSEFGKPT